jgi:hypothetical protein
MVASSRRARGFFKPNFDQLDLRITPSDGGLHFEPTPMIQIDLTDQGLLNVVAPVTAGPAAPGVVIWPSDPHEVVILATTF